MAAVRHFALGCCLLCSAAGIVRIFWPENGFKPVINTVLVLYIVSSAVPLAQHADWQDIGRQLRGWVRQGGSTAVPQNAELALYTERLGRLSAAEALRDLLAQAGITAQVEMEAERCRVVLYRAADRTAAEAIVAQACGETPYSILVIGQGGEMP